MADEEQYTSEEERYQDMRVEGREASAPDDFEGEDDGFEEVEL